MRRYGCRRAPPAAHAGAARPQGKGPRPRPLARSARQRSSRSAQSLPLTRPEGARAGSSRRPPSDVPPPQACGRQADASGPRPPPRRAKIGATHAVCPVLRHLPQPLVAAKAPTATSESPGSSSPTPPADCNAAASTNTSLNSSPPPPAATPHLSSQAPAHPSRRTEHLQEPHDLQGILIVRSD
jgi:hypothetical protein